MRVIGIIPARYGSTRFPGKPLALILGKTLIERTYIQAKKCSLLDAVVIATDDQRIFDCAKGFGADVVMTSPSCLNGTERLWDAVKNNSELLSADIYVNIQGDEPTVEPETIAALVRALKENPNECMATLVTRLTDPEKIASPSICKCVFNTAGHALYFSRSPIPFQMTSSNVYKHIGLYAYRSDFLKTYVTLQNTPLQIAEDLEQLKVLEHGYKIIVSEVGSDALDVNTQEDIQKVEDYLCKQQKKDRAHHAKSN